MPRKKKNKLYNKSNNLNSSIDNDEDQPLIRRRNQRTHTIESAAGDTTSSTNINIDENENNTINFGDTSFDGLTEFTNDSKVIDGEGRRIRIPNNSSGSEKCDSNIENQTRSKNTRKYKW